MAGAASPRLSILFYTDDFLPNVGGAEMQLHHLAREMHARGHHVVVLAPAVGKRTSPTAPAHHHAHPPSSASGYAVVRYRRPFSKRYGVRLALPRLTHLHHRHRFDVVHGHAAYPQGFVAASFRRIFGVPYVLRPHGNDVLPGERIRRHPRLEARLRAALSWAGAVVAQGEYLAGVLRELGVGEARLVTIHNGVDLAAFRGAPAREDRDARREPEGARPYLLGLGNLNPRKGFDVLVRAYARSAARETHDLVIAGEGGERQRLAETAAELGVADRVRLPGHASGEPKADLYRGASLFVCPSRREPFANVILEAMAAGTPVVASDVGGNREILAAGERGALFPAEDEGGLAAALDRLLTHPELARRFVASAGVFVETLDWPRVAAQYEELYREVIAR